jgi:hypothetical protein
VRLAQCQESVNAAGGDAMGNGGTVAFTVGQVVYTTNTNVTGTISRGVQQPYEIYSMGIAEDKADISISVFPNPTADNLTLEISEYTSGKLYYHLLDMQGRLLAWNQITVNQMQISTAGLPPGTYFMHVVNQVNKKVQSFKIVKN